MSTTELEDLDDGDLVRAPERAGQAPRSVVIDPVAHARRVIAEHDAARVAECQAKIQALLDEYGLEIRVTPAQAVIAPRAQ